MRMNELSANTNLLLKALKFELRSIWRHYFYLSSRFIDLLCGVLWEKKTSIYFTYLPICFSQQIWTDTLDRWFVILSHLLRYSVVQRIRDAAHSIRSDLHWSVLLSNREASVGCTDLQDNTLAHQSCGTCDIQPAVGFWLMTSNKAVD